MSGRVHSYVTIPLLLVAVCLATVIGAPGVSSMPSGRWVYAAGPPVDEPGLPEAEEPSPPPYPVVPEDASSGYYIHVSLDEQLVRIYFDGEEVRRMVCSGGTADMPTPTGRFYLQNRGEQFFSRKYQQGARWWVSFRDWGIYLFHSVPFDADGEIIPEEAAKLGQPASHGCIRLLLEDAKWFYETMPEGATVDIE